jgi:hypothetical protein
MGESILVPLGGCAMAIVDWRRYLESYWGVQLVDEAPSWREYRLDNPSGSIVCRSMLMKYELAMLYALARDHFSGKGVIVDAGPLTGLTTNALARGILHGAKVERGRRRIFAFDLFDYISNQECLAHVADRNGSILDTFLDVNRDYLDLVSVCAGDLQNHAWNSGPIEIAMIDLAKTWSLNDFVVDEWFPHIMVGGFVVQQDYCAFTNYWGPITMVALKDHFEFIDYAMGGSTIFRCTKAVPPSMSQQIRNLPFSVHEAMLDEAIESAPAPIKPVLTCTKALFYIAHQQQDRALSLLSEVCTTSLTNDFAIDFHGLALGSRATAEYLAKLPGSELGSYGICPPGEAAAPPISIGKLA